MFNELKKYGFMQQSQSDYFSLSIRAVGGHVTSRQLNAIQLAADKYARGFVHLTSRQDVKIPFIHVENVESIKKFLIENGVNLSAFNSSIRSITACQGKTICKAGLIDTLQLADDFDKHYCNIELPIKLKVGFAGCSNNCIRVQENDIGIKDGLIPQCNLKQCKYCKACEKVCKANAIEVGVKTWSIDMNKCINCGKCVKACQFAALSGETGFIIILGGQITLPIVFGENNLYKVVDSIFEFTKENAETGERFKNMIKRVGSAKLIDYIQSLDLFAKI